MGFFWVVVLSACGQSVEEASAEVAPSDGVAPAEQPIVPPVAPPATPPSEPPALGGRAALSEFADALESGDLERQTAAYHPAVRAYAGRELDDWTPSSIQRLRDVAAGPGGAVVLPPEAIVSIRSRLGADAVERYELAGRGRPRTILIVRVSGEWFVADVD